MIVLDTHIWIWFLTDDKKLPKNIVKSIINDPLKVIVSSISVWETLVLAEKGRLDLGKNPDKILRESLSSYPFLSAPVTDEIAILSRTLNFKHEDPADRIIAATALVSCNR